MEVASETILKDDIRRTLLYYEVFEHPLALDELYFLFPRNSISRERLSQVLDIMTVNGDVWSSKGFFYLQENAEQVAEQRLERERRAQRRMNVAMVMAHIMKRIPFVRGVFLTGDLSKGVAHPSSDIDFLIVTEPGRLWICRMLLTLFKKTLLLNRKKYFCLNYFVDSNSLTLGDRTYYTATEIAHLKPLFNTDLLRKYLNANSWIRNFFPNYNSSAFKWFAVDDNQSVIQRLLELPLKGSWADELDESLMDMMRRVWKKRYPEYEEKTRDKIFRCNRNESTAFVGDFSDAIMSVYHKKLYDHNLS